MVNIKKIWLILLIIIPFTVKANDLASNAEAAILIDYNTGNVLFEKEADKLLSPASMTKMMTLLLTMEAINENKITMDSDIFISAAASSMGGSQVFLEPNTNMKARELIKSIAIASANDSAYALGEAVSGNITDFVLKMNNRAKELGCNNTTFKNVHGLDEEGHLTTARDMSLIAKELLKYEELLEYTSTYEEYLKKPDGSSTWMVNTNKVVC